MLRHLCSVGLALCLLPTSASAQALPSEARPVLSRAGRAPLLVIDAEAQASWERGPLRLLRREWPTEVARAASVSRLPAAARRELLGTYRLYDGAREVCVARLGRPLVFRHVSPDDELAASGLGPGETPLTRAQVAEVGWRSAGRSLLVAPAEAMRGDCARATWASRGPLRFSASVEPDSATLAAFRGLETYLDLAAAWTEAREYDDDPAAAHWDERSAGVERTVTRLPIGERTFTLITAAAHPGCGEFTGALWAVYETTAEGPVLLATDAFAERPWGLADLDGDGVPEVLAHQRWVSLTGGASVDLSAPDLGCPC